MGELEKNDRPQAQELPQIHRFYDLILSDLNTNPVSAPGSFKAVYSSVQTVKVINHVDQT